ncbi:beta-L-arabinofuranosidase domain-containing protein [Spirosoma sp.]|uniref:beta-L-arabinofuranosidase domain-containing protein n=1 Tax=Spirosoma sp. TaxID=1899569 RepID=UPI002605B06B|nr:beta-L-arabinofuranosidase domain-containing protein [Spirosoma sp.]MCX6215304.1 glycoside hydrolase family 127 protein [Spirosoma sp.]
MNRNILLTLLLLSLKTWAQNQPLPEKYQPLLLGEIKPTGWIKTQMRQDLQGFSGNLDRLVPDLILKDDIYGKNRLTKAIKSKDVGALGLGENDVQILWWNSETQSNWRDGFVRQAFLSGDLANQRKAKAYISHILATQDADGYLGVYAPDLRYKLTGENGELWAKASLFRVLLSYYELTKDAKTWQALLSAVDNVMVNYPINRSSPFKAEKPFAGLSHGLVFTDVLDRLHQLTGNRKYVDYALFLYRDYSKNTVSETDVQLPNILNDSYLMHGHGVHSYEHLRPLIVAYWASGADTLKEALDRYTHRINQLITPSGGPIGDEWITRQTADATQTGYEYCSIHELLHSHAVLLQKSGEPSLADAIERSFFNAAQGARHPTKSSIAYLKTDNSFAMTGTKNDGGDPKQTRYKYSPAHQDAAVCCVPNAGRIASYYVQSMWVKDADGLVANLLGPCQVSTRLGTNRVRIDETTEYPYQNNFVFTINAEKPFLLKIRKPAWVEQLTSSQAYETEGAYIKMMVKGGQTVVKLAFQTSVKQHSFAQHETFFSYGPLVYALPFAAQEAVAKSFPVAGFFDLTYRPVQAQTFRFSPGQKVDYQPSGILIEAINTKTQAVEQIRLVPMAKTILRQVTF